MIGAIEGDKENSKENNRNDAIAAQLLEITQGTYNRITEAIAIVAVVTVAVVTAAVSIAIIITVAVVVTITVLKKSHMITVTAM